jgi:beta-lactam-binding protein with PASTA domain
VPDVHGMPLRSAVRTLHLAGFRVELTDGPLGTTTPSAGAVGAAGSLIRLGAR